jgi:hypothetical protein
VLAECAALSIASCQCVCFTAFHGGLGSGNVLETRSEAMYCLYINPSKTSHDFCSSYHRLPGYKSLQWVGRVQRFPDAATATVPVCSSSEHHHATNSTRVYFCSWLPLPLPPHPPTPQACAAWHSNCQLRGSRQWCLTTSGSCRACLTQQ